MLETGALGWSDLEGEVGLGYFRPSLLVELQEMPHGSGWSESAAGRYAELDARAGFVKHAEVYRRKKARAQAVKLYEQRAVRAG